MGFSNEGELIAERALNAPASGAGRSSLGLRFGALTSQRVGLVALSLSVCVLMLLPIFYLLLRAGEAEASSWDLILRNRTVWLALRSIGLAVAVTVATLVIGVPLAWLTTRTDLPGRRLWAVAVALPLVIPSYVGALALMASLGPRGIFQGWFESWFGIQRLPDISGFPGAFIALTLFTYPYVYLLVAAGIKGLDPSLEEAARSLGRSPWRTFREITLPLLRPSIAAGGLLVALYTLHDFGAVSLMRYQAFTQAIYLQYKGAFDRTPAAILSLMLVALAVIALWAERRARGRARYYRSHSGSKRPLAALQLGRWKWPALAFCSAVTLAALVVPVGVLVFWLLRGGGDASVVGETATAVGGSISASGLAGGLAVLAALPVALVAARYPGRLTSFTEKLSYSGYSLPGIVVALAFVFFAANFTPGIYQTLPLVIIAYVVLFLPQASEPLKASLLQVGPRIEEAGRALGRGRTKVFVSLVVPLIWRGALTGFALVFLTAMKELPATLLLRPTGFETLATRVWTEASVGLFAKAALPALVLMLVCSIPLYFLARRVEVEKVEVRSD
ncbi:MAG: ABC transporter permease [Actinomycetota bacterium]